MCKQAKHWSGHKNSVLEAGVILMTVLSSNNTEQEETSRPWNFPGLKIFNPCPLDYQEKCLRKFFKSMRSPHLVLDFYRFITLHWLPCPMGVQ